MGKPEVVALIPARGGSKSVPRKNVRELGNHPLIAYSIASALSAVRVGRVIVSTDDKEIAQIAKQYGAEVPFLRPDELAEDNTPDFPVLEHAVNWLESEENYHPDVVVQLRPTSPLRPKGLIDDAIEIFVKNPGVDCVRAVVESSENPFKMWLVDQKGFMQALMKGWGDEPYNMPRQNLPKTYWQTGHIDVIDVDLMRTRKSLTGKRILPVFVNRRYCIDIDESEDFHRAEELLSSGQLSIDQPFVPSPTGSGVARRPSLPEAVGLVISDFDGVLTDNRVFVLEDGKEAVACNRADGLAIHLLREAGVAVVVLSSEVNGVVAQRCRKIGVECYSGQEDKPAMLVKISQERNIPLDNCLYVGNDLNDLKCMSMVGWPVAVADAAGDVRSIARIVLRSRGGQGALRELAGLVARHTEQQRAEGNRTLPPPPCSSRR